MTTRNSHFFTIAALLVFTFTTTTVSRGQITINLPKLPKIFKERAAPSTSSPRGSTTPEPSTVGEAKAADQKSADTEEPPAVRSDCESDGRTSYHLMELEKVKKETESWVPGKSSYFAGMLAGPRNEYIEAALYPKEREELFAKQSPIGPKCITPALDELATIARKKLPAYTGPAGYINGTAAEKRLLLTTVSGINEGKIYAIGLLQPNWVIAKDNYNFPTARYKHGMFIFKNPTREFCWVFYANIVQDYAGGGTYGASYANYIGRVVAGCPAAK